MTNASMNIDYDITHENGWSRGCAPCRLNLNDLLSTLKWVQNKSHNDTDLVKVEINLAQKLQEFIDFMEH